MSIKILDCIQWTAPIKSSTDFLIPNTKYWLRSDIVPKKGQTRLILTPYCYRLDLAVYEKQYLLYQPALLVIVLVDIRDIQFNRAFSNQKYC